MWELETFSFFTQFECVCIPISTLAHSRINYVIFGGKKVTPPLPPKSEVAPTQPKIPLQASVPWRGADRKIHFRVSHYCAFLIVTNSADNTEAYFSNKMAAD